MISKDIIDAFSDLAKDRGIDRTSLGTIIEDLFLNLIHKKYGEERDNFSVIANMEKGEIEIYQHKTVVEKVSDKVTEITLDDARKVEKGLDVGDMYIEVINPQEFGRRLINNAKQFLSQSLKDIEKQSIFDEYSDNQNNFLISHTQRSTDIPVQTVGKDNDLYYLKDFKKFRKKAC